MVLNSDEHSFMLFGVKDELQTDFVSNNIITKKHRRRKSLGIKTDNKLNFSTHLTEIIKKANIKLNAFTGVQKDMTLEQKALLTSSFIKS